jgi:hypothetical protein
VLCFHFNRFFVAAVERCKNFGWNWLGNRVTGWGECEPIRRLFTFGRFLKIAKEAQMFGQLICTQNVKQ